MNIIDEQYVIGVDFGTDSVRALLIAARTGEEMATAVFPYPRWKEGLYCNPVTHQFRQHPKDYLESFTHVITECLNKVGKNIRQHIKAISIDTTGSTPVAVDQYGQPLALRCEFEEDPDAMFILWKDHTALQEAEQINEHAKKNEIDYLKFVGGVYSSEWYWSKLLHILRNNEKVCSAAHGWVEHSDWMPFVLTGGKDLRKIKRNVCTAGHKALWANEWNGFPPASFFTTLDPILGRYIGQLSNTTYTADQVAGYLSKDWALTLGLSEAVLVGIGAMDAHMGAVGGQIEPYFLSKVMGTSTCDILVAPSESMEGKYVAGICGMVNGSVIPGMIGMEAGQSAFGDVYAWFKNVISWPLTHLGNNKIDSHTIKGLMDEILPALSVAAEGLPNNLDDELSLDWFNGRRSPNANASVKGALQGLYLGSDAVHIFRSLVEGTCFGAKAIIETFIRHSLSIKGVIGIGGVAKKSPFIMQMMADVLGIIIKVSKSEQTSALGAAMFAATVAGIYDNIETAMAKMGQGFDQIYVPNKERVSFYEKRYKHYCTLGSFIENQYAASLKD